MHSSLTTLQSNSIAFINQKEKTPYGYVCLYGSILTIIMSPIAGIIADCIYTDYHGYSFLFLFFSPLILITFIIISLLKPCVNILDDVNNREFKVRDLFQNKTYLNYFFIVIILMPFNSLTSSLSSTMWTMRKTNYVSELFTSKTWGIILACQALVETVIIYINVKVGLSKKVENNFKIAPIALSTSLIFLSIAASIILKDYSITFFILLLFSMSIRGIITGIYLTSNFGNLNKMMNYRYRTKAVFLQNGTYQIINCIFSFIYPLLIVDRDAIDDALICLLFALFAVAISINYTLQKDKYQKISF